MTEKYATSQANRINVPVLDLTPLLAGGNVDQLVHELKSACLDTGFFYVVGHGIPQSVIEELFNEARSYFSQPQDQLRQDEMDQRFRRGYVPFGTSKHPGSEVDLKEAFAWGLDCPFDDEDVQKGKPLHGPNKWPSGPIQLRSAAETCSQAFSSLGMRLLELLALSLQLDRDHFQGMFQKPCTTNRVVHYPPQTVMREGQFGATEHTDFDLLTVLAQDPIGGLEIRRRDGEWLAAPFIPGSLVINIGDLCRMWTNDVYVSTPHRVINRTGRERFSAVTFLYLISTSGLKHFQVV